MSKIISIGTAVPHYQHQQDRILDFMQRVYAPDETNRRKLKFLYRQGGITTRYSVIPDYSLPAAQWQFYSPTENLEPFPSLEKRMQWFQQHAAALSKKAIDQCLEKTPGIAITHLITVSCTGMSAPGLDLELMELLQLPATINRTSINFMGCYAAIHAMKLADAYCRADSKANVLIVCTELCTLHFQKEATIDNITSSMLFSDGAAALLISGNNDQEGLTIDKFYSTVALKGKSDMAWQLSSQGFLMTLSGYVADLIEEDFNGLVQNALMNAGLNQEAITHWCVHPGGKKILEAVHKSLGFTNGQLQPCYEVLREYGNMSSPTVLFVLQKIMQALDHKQESRIFGAAFGPGLTMETFILSA
ncbi:MAG TPA: type III polyketide synthase [Chitinophagaceae bacterium]